NDQASAAAPLKLVTPRLSCHGSAAFRARSRAAPLKLGCQRLPTFPRGATPAIRKSLLLIGKCEMPRGKSLFPVGKCEMPTGKSLFPVGKCEMRTGKSLFLIADVRPSPALRSEPFPRGIARGPIGFSYWGG